MKVDPIKQKILSVAKVHMVKFGYRKVTMDEIAADLVMSKNTIYKHFHSKEELAKALVAQLQVEMNSSLSAIEKTQPDPLKIFSESILLLRKQLGPWFEHFFKELAVELPGLWEEFLRYRNGKILGIRILVEKGIRKGTFRKVNASIAVEAYLGAIKAVINHKFLEQENITFDAALEAVLDIWAKGILNVR
jgi:AcrR family transcriptional regulator